MLCDNAIVVRQHFTTCYHFTFGFCIVAGNSNTYVHTIINIKVGMARHKYKIRLYVAKSELCANPKAKLGIIKNETVMPSA